MSADTKTFSTFLKVPNSKFIMNGLLDQPLMSDARYYIDLFKIKEATEPEFVGCYEKFITHFTNFFKLLKKSKSLTLKNMSAAELNSSSNEQLKKIVANSDIAFKGAFKLLDFREVDGFNLGYSSGLRGASIGLRFKMILMHTAHELLELDIDDPEVFCLLPFLQEGIGCDRISDMFISICYENFLKYTERKLVELSAQNVMSVTLSDVKYNLAKPKVFKQPLILIPKKYITSLPQSFCWSDLIDSYDENSALRDKLNKLILSKYRTKEDVTKEVVSQILKTNPSLLKEIINEFKGMTSLVKVERNFFEEIEEELENIELPELNELQDKVLFILNKFKWFVEKKSLWRLFYHKQTPLSEDHIQRAFFVIAELLCEQFNISVIPEADTGVGIVDFKFLDGRKSILIEAKLTTHERIQHGYVTQLTEYIEAENPVYSYFLVVILQAATNDKDKADIRRYNRLIKVKVKPTERKALFVVNARPKISASKK